ncbi:MAG: hypothetical protein QNJ97_13480 [Myxococcota bacterium]|nr:hypothetical protein [Myxococcota bacterium]
MDRSIGGKIVANALRDAGATVNIHDDYFEKDAPDEAWLLEVSNRGWIAITKDIAIGRSSIQRLEVAWSGARLFSFMSGGMTGLSMAKSLVSALTRIGRICASEAAPFIAKVYRSGDVSVWKTDSDLLAELEKYSPG